MIGSAKRKLKQNSGATILMALMLFLACVTIAGVILGSAMTNLNKVKNQQEQLQVYESVSSAARLVCQRMQGVTYTASESVKSYTCLDLTNNEHYSYDNFDPKREDHSADRYQYNKPKITAGGSDQFTQLIQEGVEEVYRSELKYEGNQSLVKPFTQWEKSFEIDDFKCKVNVTVSIDKNYQLTFKFRPLDEKWKDDYNVTLLVPTISKPKPADSHDTLSCTHSYDKKNNVDGSTERIKDQTFDIKQTTLTTTITYGTGTIYKGASGE